MTHNFRFAVWSRLMILAAIVLFTTSGDAARLCCEGDKWLKWGVETREYYILGLIQGYQSGRLDGCEAAFANTHNASVKTRACTGPHKSDPYDVDHITELITQFYTQYPKENFFYIREVLEAVAENPEPN